MGNESATKPTNHTFTISAFLVFVSLGAAALYVWNEYSVPQTSLDERVDGAVRPAPLRSATSTEGPLEVQVVPEAIRGDGSAYFKYWVLWAVGPILAFMVLLKARSPFRYIAWAWLVSCASLAVYLASRGPSNPDTADHMLLVITPLFMAVLAMAGWGAAGTILVLMRHLRRTQGTV